MDNATYGVAADTYFAIIPEWVLDAEITSPAVRLYAVLRRYADQNGNCFPTRKTLATRVRVSEATIDRLIKELQGIGALMVRNRKAESGGYTSSMYTVVTVRGVYSPMSTGVLTHEDRGVLTSDDRTIAIENQSHELDLSRASLVDRFNEFWAAYPRKIGKPAAERAYRKIKPAEHEALMGGLAVWVKYWDERGQPEYTPHPSTFLNQRRWEDQPTPKMPVKESRLDNGGAFAKIAIMSEARDRLVEAGFYPAGTQLKEIDWSSAEVVAILGKRALEIQP